PKFDLIIGNPPWGYKFSRDEARLLADHYYTAGTKGGVESYNLFIEWAINKIADNGIISYILPEAFLTVRLHARARQLILKNCRINKVTCFGTIFPEVNAPVISLVMQRTDKFKQNYVKIKTDGKDYRVPQASFSNMDFSFNVFGSKTDYEIIRHLRSEVNVQYLKGNADFALGIVTGNNKKYVLKQPQANSEVVITGRDVFKYRIRPGGSYLVYRRDRFQQVASDYLYRAEEKLLYRFINSRLVFAYDDNQLLSLNSANILIPRFSNMSIKYVLAVLNSRIAQFYHAVTNPSPKVLRSQLETIPICVCGKKQENIIVGLVNSIIISEKPAQRREIYEEIDRRLMNYYMLPAKYQAYIRRKNQIVELL
ncbi:MAG: N-6 DNA methylase, partial [Firmicutes bacterium]|nr:N-6 DNA methylase [Bacillota bacterium]